MHLCPWRQTKQNYIPFRKSPWPNEQVWILRDITFKGQVENLGVSSTLFQRLEGFFGGDFFGIFFFT
jgi:hypothetical protein